MQKLQTLIYQSQQEDVTSEHNDQPIRGSVCVCVFAPQVSGGGGKVLNGS